MLLKVVMSPLEPSVAFVEQYVRLVQGECGGGGERRLTTYLSHFADTDATELTKLLDMKGVKRSEHAAYLELYRDQAASLAPPAVTSVAAAAVASSLPGSPAHSGSDGSRIAKLEKMIKNRL